MIIQTKNWAFSALFILGISIMILNSCKVKDKAYRFESPEAERKRHKAMVDSIINSYPAAVDVKGGVAIRTFRDGSKDTISLEEDEYGNSKVDLFKPKTKN